jgi:sugar phosphate isomerase/epimerase
VDEFSKANAARVDSALRKYDIEATAVATLGPGPKIWDFYHGPLTVGLVPKQWRQARIDALKRASDFARQLGIPAIHTHCGFIPENPNDPLYAEVVSAIHQVVGYCRTNRQTFLYETGQESPITLLRAIQDVGLDNQGVNLDTANLILYGKGNPVDALDVLGQHVRGLHAKDGLFPVDPHRLGEEVPIGSGKADFSVIIQKLRRLKYTGPMTIEREISGPQQIEHVRREKQYLERLLHQHPA